MSYVPPKKYFSFLKNSQIQWESSGLWWTLVDWNPVVLGNTLFRVIYVGTVIALLLPIIPLSPIYAVSTDYLLDYPLCGSLFYI